jgi:uncharacterized membrane protein
VSGDFYEATEEMDARDWPQILDLVVAIVSGLAAAYASGRPGLLAALPGVAIASALVPPVATSGLAMSIGDYDVAIGAVLLFGVNMVAIIVAAAVALRAMGIHCVAERARLTSWIGRSLLGLMVATTLAMTFVPPRLAPNRELVEAVENALTDDHRLRDIRLRKEPAGLTVQVDVGGVKLPDTGLKSKLRDVAQEHLGADAGVRLTFRYEGVAR